MRSRPIFSAKVGPVREDDRRDDVVAVVALLHRSDPVRVNLDVVPLERDPMVAQEALGPSAVRAPARPVDPDDVVHPLPIGTSRSAASGGSGGERYTPGP